MINVPRNCLLFVYYIYKLFKLDKNFSSRYSGSNGRSKDYKYKMSEIFLSPTHAAISKYNENFNEVDFQKCRNDAMIDRNCVARLNESEQYFKKDLPCFTTGYDHFFYSRILHLYSI